MWLNAYVVNAMLTHGRYCPISAAQLPMINISHDYDAYLCLYFVLYMHTRFIPSQRSAQRSTQRSAQRRDMRFTRFRFHTRLCIMCIVSAQIDQVVVGFCVCVCRDKNVCCETHLAIVGDRLSLSTELSQTDCSAVVTKYT